MKEPRTLNLHLRELAHRYAEALKQTLGDQLVSVVLFGSVARSEATSHSDIDLLVILEETPRGMTQRRALLEPARGVLTPDLELLWNLGVYVDFVEIIRSREEARRFHPVYLDMTQEALLLYDKGGFMAGILDALSERLRVLQASRKRLGKIWYWDLKPEFWFGEVIK